MIKCTCEFCRIYDLYKWATITECKCGCHYNDDIIGHESLCCEFPNGNINNNPHTNLKLSKEYLKMLNDFERSQ